MNELAKSANAWRKAKERERLMAAEMYEQIRRAVKNGMSESEAARVSGVDRMTIRRALGKL